MLHDFVNSCAKHIDTFFDGMLQFVDSIGSMVGGFCGLAALFYIGFKVWGNYSRGESIEIYPLLRPFVIGLLCANFNVVVVGGLRGLADPVCEYFQGLEENSNELTTKAEFKKKVDQCRQKVADLEAKRDKSEEDASIWDSIGKWIKSVWQKFWDLVFIGLAWLIGLIADLFAALTKFVLIFTRCFSLSILCLLGPIVFAISIFPGYKQGLSQWIARFVCIYMWMPLFCLCDIFINTVTSGIGDILLGNIDAMIDNAMAIEGGASNEAIEAASYKLQGISANMALIGALISLLTAALYKSVPTLASWIIAGGDSSGQLSSVAGFATNTAAFAGMAATVLGGGVLKAGAVAARAAGGAAGKGLAKAGGKIAGKTPGASASGNVTSMGAGPMDAPVRTPVGFQPSAAAAENTAVVTPPPATGLRMRDGGEAMPAVSESDLRSVSKFRQLTGNTLEWVGKQMRRPKLAHIMRYGNAQQRHNAAQDPYATKGILKKALKDPNIFVQQAALNNANVSPKLLKRAMKYGYEETATKAAHMLLEKQGGKVSPGTQQVFNANIATSNRPGGKSAVPATEGVPEPQPIGFNRSAAAPVTSQAEGPSVSKFRKVTGSTLEWVGKQMRRPKLNHIMKYGNARQRYNAAKDPYITRGVLKKAIVDPDQAVQMSALSNAKVTQKLLKRAAKYGYDKTSTEALRLLNEMYKTKKGAKNGNQ